MNGSQVFRQANRRSCMLGWCEGVHVLKVLVSLLLCKHSLLKNEAMDRRRTNSLRNHIRQQIGGGVIRVLCV